MARSWQAASLRRTTPTTEQFGKRGAHRPAIVDAAIVGAIVPARTNREQPLAKPKPALGRVRHARGVPLGDPATRGKRIKMLKGWTPPTPAAAPNPLAAPRRAWITDATDRPKSRLEARLHTVAARQLAVERARKRGPVVALSVGVPAVNFAKGVHHAGTRTIDQRPIAKKRHQSSRVFSISPDAARRIQAKPAIVTSSVPVETSSLLDVNARGSQALTALQAKKAGIPPTDTALTTETRPAWLDFAFLAGVVAIGFLALRARQ